MGELRFDGRVAIVTGAGGGLGRSHALVLAARGAKVVVNDLGGSAHGSGQSTSAADKVVAEIRALGGEAVANYDSVENGEAIVKTALDAFGTVDIVINNAGILRDVSFNKMTQADWDLVLRVHLTGSMSVSHAAWPIMRDKGFGRIVMTTSAAGIYGNFGQANYSAAKLGILGLANTLAEEGRSKNVLVNTIAPLAASRLTETIMPPQLLEMLQPEAVAWLCHEACKETKSLFEVGAGYIAKLRWERTAGYFFPNKRPFTLDDVAKRWQKITDFSESTHPTNTTESITPIISGISNPPLGGNEFIDLDLAAKTKLELESSYDERDLALYALGIGAARDPLDRNELKYVYEMGGSFAALPTFGVMPQMNAMLSAAKKGGLKLPGMNFGFERLLHGEQYTEIKRPLPPHAKLKHTFKLKQAWDKAPNAVVTFAISSCDEQGNEVVYNEMTAFVKGAGGWGGDRGPSTEENLPPAREPDAVIEEKTDANQTLLYRLSGDWNPLHADPDFAKAFGYDRPILHGLCTYGYCGRHVIKAFSNNDPRYFKSIKVRFAKSVFPGDTLITRMWKESDTRVVFETLVKERNEVVIKNAAIELYKEIPQTKPAVTAPAQQQEAAKPAASQSAEPQVSDVFTAIRKHIESNAGLVGQVGTVFQFKFADPDSSWAIDLKNGSGAVTEGVIDKPDVTLELSQANFIGMCTGAEDAQKLYFGGKLKISGNIMASNKLAFLQKMDPQLVKDAMAQRLKSGVQGPETASGTANAAAKAAPSAPAVKPAPKAPELVEKLSAHLGSVERNTLPASNIVLTIGDIDRTWTLDVAATPAIVREGGDASAKTSLVINDSEFELLANGKAELRDLYQHGKLRVNGELLPVHQLGFLKGFL
jgi:NAD(P)-dependent dehydrogenase (short-subunit alcohol dehydrogenase family)/acyl dehydratase/putative sterol carrier protein